MYSNGAPVARGVMPTLALPTLALAAAVAMAVADSSIVVLALPNLYGAFNTTIQGVAWVITSYNLVVALGALALVPVARRLRAGLLTAVGLGLFLLASIGCAASVTIGMLIGFRCAQGLGAALLLAGSLRLLGTMRRSGERGTSLWIAAGTVGVAIGPALGGVLTQLFDWRAIFVAQVPVAALALVATVTAGTAAPAEEPVPLDRRAVAANLGLAFVFAALVGALFLSVLLVITVWGLSPTLGALVVTALPVAALAARPLDRLLSTAEGIGGGALLLALGLLALALLPTRSSVLVAAALALAGAGLGLAVPILTRLALGREVGDTRSGLFTIGARHAGLVGAIVLIAPVLAHSLESGSVRATRAGAAAILDANLPLTTKVPLALDLRNAIEAAPRGQVPDLSAPFQRRGAGSDPPLRHLEADLVGTLEDTLTRSFRSAFALCALFAALTFLPLAWLQRRKS